MSHPSQAQIEAGNYKKRHISFQGLEIAIENPKGSVRSGVDRGGKAWSIEMHDDYGYVNGSMGVDGDQVDVFVGRQADADTVYVITTMAPPTFSKRDENKCMLGYVSAEEAKAAFLSHYDDKRFFGSMLSMPIEEFKAKVRATKDSPALIKGHVGEWTDDDIGRLLLRADQKRNGGIIMFVKSADLAAISGMSGNPLQGTLERSPLRADESGSVTEPAHVGIASVGEKDHSMLAKTHVNTYTKQDGTVVQAHEDTRAAGHSLVRGRFNWEVHKDGEKIAEYPAHISKKNLLEHHFNAVDASAKEKEERSTKAKISSGKNAEIKKTLGELRAALAANESVINAAHMNRRLNFHAMPIEDFTAKDTIQIHQSKGYGKKKGSEYRLVMVSGKPAYARESDHWGEFSTVDRGVNEEPKNLHEMDTYYLDEYGSGVRVNGHQWNLDGGNDSGHAKGERRAGYVFLEDLVALRGREKLTKGMDMDAIGRMMGDFGKAPPTVLFIKAHVRQHTRVVNGRTVVVSSYDNKVVVGPKETRHKPDPFTLDLFGEAARPVKQAELRAAATHSMPKQEAIAEHERLVDVLNSPSHADDKVEEKKQANELAEITGATDKKKILFVRDKDVATSSKMLHSDAVETKQQEQKMETVNVVSREAGGKLLTVTADSLGQHIVVRHGGNVLTSNAEFGVARGLPKEMAGKYSHMLSTGRTNIPLTESEAAIIIAGRERLAAKQEAAAREQKARLEANVPGLAELRELSSAVSNDDLRYSREFNRMMEDENNDGARSPRQVDESRRGKLVDMLAKYPRAALYLRAENTKDGAGLADNNGKIESANNAMNILENGGSLDDAERALRETNESRKRAKDADEMARLREQMEADGGWEIISLPSPYSAIEEKEKEGFRSYLMGRDGKPQESRLAGYIFARRKGV